MMGVHKKMNKENQRILNDYIEHINSRALEIKQILYHDSVEDILNENPRLRDAIKNSEPNEVK